jgi:hypothetical protein
VVFEIQLSSQDADTTLERTRRYRRAGLPCVWLMRRLPYLRGGFPGFQLVSPLAFASVDVAGQRVRLGEFIEALVERRLSFRPARPARRGFVRVHRLIRECGGCERFISVVGASIEARCECEQVAVETARTPDVERLLEAVVHEARATGDLQELRDAPMTRGDACPYCAHRQGFAPTRYGARTKNWIARTRWPSPRSARVGGRRSAPAA